MTKLQSLAYARTGDKGDDSIVGIYCLSSENFEAAKNFLTAPNVARHFDLPASEVTVTCLPGLLAFTVVVRGVLAGGVTRSLRSDPHGKTLGSYLLELTSD